jgi:hypothetical protein
MPDEMPAHTCQVHPQRFELRLRFLDTALADIFHPGRDRLCRQFTGKRFRNSDKRNISRIRTTALRCLRDTLSYLFDFVFYH